MHGAQNEIAKDVLGESSRVVGGDDGERSKTHVLSSCIFVEVSSFAINMWVVNGEEYGLRDKQK